MIGFEEALRLARLQERIRSATYHELRKDGHHKSDEGFVSLAINLPPVVGGERAPYWTVEVWSYLLCPEGRSKTWRGLSPAEAIGKAEDAVGDWCFMPEMEMFETAMGGPPDDDGDTSEEEIPA